MAWLNAFLLLSVICLAQQAVDLLFVPSQPKCKIPFNANTEIHCSWEPGPYPALYYTLHWEPNHCRNVTQVKGNLTKAVIQRICFSKHSDMCVWVTAWNAQINKMSNKTCFNTEIIEQQGPPKVRAERKKPLEISWKFDCESYDEAHCTIQYRIKNEKQWIEERENYAHGFILEDAVPFFLYEFRVRCACKVGELVPLSDWSSICEVLTPEAEPVGVLDVWAQCRHVSEHSDCALLWKELPRHMARGNVFGYIVTLQYGIKKKSTNVSADAVKWREDERDRCCRLLMSLKEVTGVYLRAYSLQGATEPAHLALLANSDRRQDGHLLVAVGKDRQSLNVSWNTSELKEPLQEYVVQYKELGRNWTVGFDWIKVANTEKSVIFSGNFRNYTPYNVSLFHVFGNRGHLLKSSIVYTVQGIPPEVRGFQISKISSTEVTLAWQHIPLIQRRGIILHYILGLGDNTEYNISEDRNNFSIQNLQPGESYKVWICAVTIKGRGPRTVINFIHPVPPRNYIIIMVMAILLILLFGVLSLFIYCRWQVSCPMVPSWCNDKVPDPINSRLFKPDERCFSAWNEPSPPETNHNMCQVEVIEHEASEDKSCLEKSQISDECTKGQICELSDWNLRENQTLEKQQEEEENDKDKASSCSSMREQNVDLIDGVEDYSTVRDTDDWTEENMSATDTQQFFSDYEKHFMPSPYEL